MAQLWIRLADLREAVDVFSEGTDEACLEVRAEGLDDPGGSTLTFGINLDDNSGKYPKVTIFEYIPPDKHIPE